MAWGFLDHTSRANLVLTAPVMRQYAILREQAATTDVTSLLVPRPKPDGSPIDDHRAHLMACAFLQFNCDYGDLIRWLEGPYTAAHRDWGCTFAALETVKDCPPANLFPSPDYERTYQACTQGVPLKAHLSSSFTSCQAREKAPISADLVQTAADVDETLRKEEKLSYHIVLPRFLWQFFPGLYLSIFRVAYRYNDPKPRLCVDPSTTLSKEDTGNVNREIPDPGVDEDENNSIYYGTAFIRYLIWIWNLRISYPADDIIQMTDDISAAFHRVLYHPDMSPAFATVWKGYLIIPVSAIFGSKSSPSHYMLRGELRAHYANFMSVPPSAMEYPLIQRLILPPAPTKEEAALFEQAVQDAANPGIAKDSNGNPERRQPPFVDDTGVAQIRDHFLTAAGASVHAAYVMFGQPEEDPNRPACINDKKWEVVVSHLLQFLGYFIDTRKMIVCWPLDKRTKLKVFLDVILDDAAADRCSTPHSISRVLGLIRHAAPVAPMGTFRSLRLQYMFNDTVAKAPAGKWLRRWYQRRQIRLTPELLSELRSFRQLISQDLYDPFWCRSIGLMVPRTPTITIFTDASTKALGGWSRIGELNHMWRITVEELIPVGINPKMSWANPHNYHEPEHDPRAVHINILEFFAIFIELWICIRQLQAANTEPSLPDPSAPAERIPHGGHRLLVRADNTSALSWLRYATRTKRAPVRRIARLLTAFLCSSFAAKTVRVQGMHLAGVANVSADHLSRFEKSASWAAIMDNCPNLTPLRICQVPQELLSLLVAVFTQEQTAAWYETATTRLRTIASPLFVTGSARTDIPTCVVSNP